MKIVICGSISSSDKLLEVSDLLNQIGIETDLPYYTQKIRDKEIDFEEYKKRRKKEGDTLYRKLATEDLIKRYYRLIGESDGILVVNVDKAGSKNHVGGNSLLEMGFAYVLDKPIYLWNEIPIIDYADEILAMKPEIINQDISKIERN